MPRKPAVASKTAPRIRLAIVDDHPMIRRGVRLTFGDLADFEVVGEGASADDAVQLSVVECFETVCGVSERRLGVILVEC